MNLFLPFGMLCVLTVGLLSFGSGVPVCKYGAKLNSDGKCVCPTVFDNCNKNESVCSSIATPFRNECELKQVSCELQKRIFVFKKGICGIFTMPGIMTCGYRDCRNVNCPFRDFAQDGNGCILCKCRAHHCESMSSCNLNCDEQGGIIVDNQGCPKCECKKPHKTPCGSEEKQSN